MKRKKQNDMTCHRFVRSVLWVIVVCLLAICLFDPLVVQAAPRLQKIKKSPIIVVIDPGHGGENEGTTECGFLEKDMTLVTAKKMAEELSKFDGIEVYLTRENDKELSLKDRAVIADQYHADFLISLHYNASECHEFFGSEVWVSLNPQYHNAGYQLGTMFLREFRDMGLTLRGIKTKRHSKGGDYYGILRESVKLDVPAIIVEHCHVDHVKDNVFCDSQEELEQFGVADAMAVAKYFGLKSASLGVDYSEEANTLPEVTSGILVDRAAQDQTPPEYCHLSLKEAFYSEDRVIVEVSGKDSDSNLIYFAYSLDGGKTFCDSVPWPEGDILTGEFSGTFTYEIEIPDGTQPLLCVRATNPYDLHSSSNLLTFDQIFHKPVEVKATEEPTFVDATDKLISDPKEEADTTPVAKASTILMVVIPVVLGLFLIFFLAYLIKEKRLKNKKENQ